MRAGLGGIHGALLLMIALLAATAGALLGLTSCDYGTEGELFVSPSNVRMAPGEYRQFKLRVATEHSDEGVFCDIWSASGGSISPEGLFRAPGEPGSYTITASRDGNHSTKVTVIAESGQSAESSSDGSVAQAEGEKERIFDNGNGLGGNPGGKIPKFTIDRPRVIIEIMTYHWDYNGNMLGTIALKNVDTGEIYGPWATGGGTGQGGVENAYWYAHPNIEIPAGTYDIVDSSPSTWFTNSQAKGFGMATIDALR